MGFEVPSPIRDVKVFLQREGLVVDVSEHSETCFGNINITLSNKKLEVRLVRDRGQWSVEIHPKSLPSETDHWYDVPLIYEEFTGNIGDGLNIDQQCYFMKSNWSNIVNNVSGPAKERFCGELLSRARSRARRLFPGRDLPGTHESV